MRSVLVFLLMLLATPALACSPALDTSSYVQKISPTAFIGRITGLTVAEWHKPGSVTFSVISSRQISDHEAEKTVSYADYGTCGKFQFNIGEVWLFSDDNPFGATVRLTPEDLTPDNGRDFEATIQRISRRLDPDHVSEPPPSKETLFEPGAYVRSETCDAEQQGQGHLTATYNLSVSPKDATTGLHHIKITNNICQGGHVCSFEGTAPPYGYGEIVITPAGQTACTLILAQTAQGVEVKANDESACNTYAHTLDECGAYTHLTSYGYLQRDPDPLAQARAMGIHIFQAIRP